MVDIALIQSNDGPLADLAPLLRSKVLAGVVEALLLERGPWTAEELAERTGAAYQTVTKEVRRLENAGFLEVTTVGRQKLLTPNRSDPTVRAFTRLLRTTPIDPPSRGGDPMAKKKKDKKKKKK